MPCFLIGVTGPGCSADGSALLGSVSDDPYDVRTYLRSVQTPGRLAHVGTELVSTTDLSLADRGYFSRSGEPGRGVNEAGLAFTIALAMEDESTPMPAGVVDFADLAERLMGECRSVADAIVLFRAAPAVQPAFSVLLADAGGDLAQVEVGRFGVAVHRHFSRETPGMVFAVNCYQSTQLCGRNQPAAQLDHRANNNGARRERGMALAGDGPLDVAAIARVLSDHANRERDPTANPIVGVWGYSICNHGTRGEDTPPEGDLPWGTVSAEILQPSGPALWYAYGWPCGEAPEHGDQRFQERSWGKFVPFGIADAPGESVYATAEGDVTPAGEGARRDG